MPRFSAFILSFFLLLGLLGPLIANERPIWCKVEGVHYWPAVRDNFGLHMPAGLAKIDRARQWNTLPASDKWMPLIAYSGAGGSLHQKLPPGAEGVQGRHWLGTDEQGRDVLAGLIQGARTALWSGCLAMLVALLAGGLLGGLAGYFGDTGWMVKRHFLWITPLLLLAVLYIAVAAQRVEAGGASYGWWPALAFGICVLGGWVAHRLPGNQKVGIPFDLILMRLAEIFDAVPKLIFLLAVGAMLPERTLTALVLLIGFVSWPGVALLLRAELLKIRKADYIQAVRDFGFPVWQILWRHALPNAVRPVAVAFALGASGAVLLEAALSFLNIGTRQVDQITWGAMLHTARDHIQLYWVWLPPGLMVSLLVGALFEWSERLRHPV